MDYKKLIAAATISTAVIVIPVTVGAEESISVRTDLIENKTYTYGDTLHVALTEIEEDIIVRHEWTYNNTTIVDNRNSGLKIPLDAMGKEVTLVVTTESGKKYEQKITIQTLPIVKLYKDKNPTNEEQITETTVNSNLTIQRFDIQDTNVTINGFEWYVIENGNYRLITGENTQTLKIPVSFQGKELLFMVKTEEGKLYAAPIKVKKLEFDEAFNDMTMRYTINGKLPTEGQTVKPGDEIKLLPLDIKGKNGEVIDPTDYTLSYKWVALNSKSNRIALSNTSDKFIVPLNSDELDYAQLNVYANIVLQDLQLSPSNNPFVAIPLSNNELSLLNLTIERLYMELMGFTENGSTPAEYEPFKQEFNQSVKTYNELSLKAKAAIKNYNKLNEMNIAYQAIAPFVTEFKNIELDRLNFDYISVLDNQAALLTRVEKLNNSVQRLSKIQKALFYGEISVLNIEAVGIEGFEKDYLAKLYEWLKKSSIAESNQDTSANYLTLNAIQNLNDEFDALVDPYDRTYDFTADIEDVPTNLKHIAAFEQAIQDLIKRVDNISKVYHPLTRISELKTALNDAKKARAVAEKIQKVEQAEDTKKRATLLQSAQTAYNKLNSYQSSLIIDMAVLLGEDDDTEQEPVISDDAQLVIDDIDNLYNNGQYNVGIVTLEEELTLVALNYKSLNSKDKKQVTNYKLINQMKKDVQAAKKVAASIVKAFKAYETAMEFENDEKRSKYVSKLKSAQSQFASAHKAYIKLTPQQIAILNHDDYYHDLSQVNNVFLVFVETYEQITAEIAADGFDEKKQYDSSKSNAVVELIREIEASLTAAEAGKQTAIADLDKTIERQINAAKAQYKTLNSYEKKLVHNYGVIATASKHLSKAKSVKNKFESASSEKKFISANLAFEKLLPVQQGLIITTYNKVKGNFVGETFTLAEIDEKIAELMQEGNYDATLVREIQNQLKLFSTKEQKTLVNYAFYQQAVKDLKAVESFVARLDKLGLNPSYSKKESIYKTFLKLSAKQQQLFNSYERLEEEIDLDKPADVLQQWVDTLKQAAGDLNGDIGDLFVNGRYEFSPQSYLSLENVEEFEQYLATLNTQYRALDSNERKLVTNYSFVKAAEKDAQAVRTLFELEEKLELAKESDKPTLERQIAALQAKLTEAQQSLYELLKY